MNALSRGIDECAEPRAWIDAQVTKLNGKHSQDNGPAHNPASFAMKTTSIPRSSRRRPPEALPSTRKSPRRHGREALLTAEIPADPRSARKRHDRPVTPEVAGSSLVAPVLTLPANRPFLAFLEVASLAG
jgi:hypothetical protein